MSIIVPRVHSDIKIWWKVFLSNVQSGEKHEKHKYPSDKCSLVWIFHQSTGHCAFKEDSFNVNRLSRRCVQAWMWDTYWMDASRECFSQMVSPREWHKSDESCIYETCPGSHYDFKYENTALEQLLHELWKHVLNLPKLHWLNTIERVSGTAKWYTQSQHISWSRSYDMCNCRPTANTYRKSCE